MKAKPRGERGWRAVIEDGATGIFWRLVPGRDFQWHSRKALTRLARLQRREIERLRSEKLDLLLQLHDVENSVRGLVYVLERGKNSGVRRG